jgi:Mg2+-importing ATPase
MQPIQVLLNNLLYDCSEIGVPLDNVDPESLALPSRWNLALIERFMLVMGPVSSLFDCLTFGALLYLFSATEPLFQTGWFIESLLTQTLVIFVVRTRRRPWRSRPHAALVALTLGAAALGLVLPLTPLGPILGFVAPPAAFYAFVLAAALAYLLIVEAVKQAFYRLTERPAA